MAITDKDQQARLQTTHDVINYGQEQKDQSIVDAGMEAQSKVLADNGIVYPTGNPAANAEPGTPLPKSWGGTGISSGGGSSGNSGSVPPKSSTASSTVAGMTSLASQQNQIAQQRAKKQVDYAVQQGVDELTRAEEDAQEQFQTQQNQVDIDEAKALDNQALYAEARGDRGGIGQAQYGQIQATAMNNRRAINSARTKLATDTQRQIADLRAKGEFQKADAVLQLTQSYLGQLMDLQKWGAEFSMQEAQFNAQLEQWDAEMQMRLAELTGEYQGKPTWQVQQAELEALAQAGVASAQEGLQPTAEQLSAMQRLYGYDQVWVDAQRAEKEAAASSEALSNALKVALLALETPGHTLSAAERAVLNHNGYDDGLIASIQKEVSQKHRKATYIAPQSSSGNDKPSGSIFEQLDSDGRYTAESVVDWLVTEGYFKDPAEAEVMFEYYASWLDSVNVPQIEAALADMSKNGSSIPDMLASVDDAYKQGLISEDAKNSLDAKIRSIYRNRGR